MSVKIKVMLGCNINILLGKLVWVQKDLGFLAVKVVVEEKVDQVLTLNFYYLKLLSLCIYPS